MKIVAVVAVLFCLMLFAEENPTSLSDGRSAVEANLRTPEGKAYDEQMGTEFMQKHLAACGNAGRAPEAT
jgi:hypothetical protein